MIDNKTSSFLGLPIYFKGNSYVYPPKIKDIANRDYERFLAILTMTNDDIEELFKDSDLKEYPSPYKLMYKNYLMDAQLRDLTNRAFEFFLHEPVTFLAEKGIIIIGNLEQLLKEGKTIEEITYITEEDYFNLQNLIRVAIGNEPIKEEKPDPNEDPRVTRLKKKFRERDKLVAKAKQKKGDVLKFDECLAAICCMGIGLTPLNIGELSYSAISTLLKTYQSKEAFDSSTMGAMFGTIDTKKTKIEYWIGNSNN